MSVLYVAFDSVYKSLARDCWDAERDAMKWWGPGPIVAHPPCGHWGKFHHVCQYPGRDCGPRAVEQVRAFGGVLEHPEYSALFRGYGLPLPGGQRDLWGGITFFINQADFGHLASKPTWLYVVGADRLPPIPVGLRRSSLRTVEGLSSRQRCATPPAFASWLLQLAAGCRWQRR